MLLQIDNQFPLAEIQFALDQVHSNPLFDTLLTKSWMHLMGEMVSSP